MHTSGISRKPDPEVDVENLPLMQWRKLCLTSAAMLVNKLTVVSSENWYLRSWIERRAHE